MVGIKGITVTLFERREIGRDKLNAPIYEEKPVAVENVLVSPAAAEDIVGDNQLYGKRAEYELSIPMGDTHKWEDCRVDFFGYSWRVFGPPRVWIGSMVPGPWNQKVKVERYE